MSENEMLEEIKSLSPSEEAILTMLIRYQNLKSELEKEKEKNKKLENDLKDKIIKMLQELEDRRNKELVIGYWSKKAMLEKLLKEE